MGNTYGNQAYTYSIFKCKWNRRKMNVIYTFSIKVNGDDNGRLGLTGTLFCDFLSILRNDIFVVDICDTREKSVYAFSGL